MSIPEDQDVNPEDPDEFYSDFTPLDRKEWNSNNPLHVFEHDRAQEEFEARRQTRIFMNQNTTKRLLFGVDKETHVDQCTCSFCGNNGYDRGMTAGLNVPRNRWGGCWVWAKNGPMGSKVFYRWWPKSFFSLPRWWGRNVTRSL